MSLMPGTVVILWCDPAGFGFAGLLLYATEVALGYSVWSGINERLGQRWEDRLWVAWVPPCLGTRLKSGYRPALTIGRRMVGEWSQIGFGELSY